MFITHSMATFREYGVLSGLIVVVAFAGFVFVGSDFYTRLPVYQQFVWASVAQD